MSDSPEPAAHDAWTQAIAALVDAYEAAEAEMRRAGDDDELYRRATQLRDQVKACEKEPAAVRAKTAERIRREHGLTMIELARRIGLSKTRTVQLLQTARGSKRES